MLLYDIITITSSFQWFFSQVCFEKQHNNKTKNHSDKLLNCFIRKQKNADKNGFLKAIIKKTNSILT